MATFAAAWIQWNSSPDGRRNVRAITSTASDDELDRSSVRSGRGRAYDLLGCAAWKGIAAHRLGGISPHQPGDHARIGRARTGHDWRTSSRSASDLRRGSSFGSLKSFSGADLGGFAIKAALDRAGIGGDQVQYVIMGQVLQAGAGQIPARQAAVKAGTR
ncbi:hypothetical protein SHIRM173S_09602 [Streptomyces hirsutus]